MPGLNSGGGEKDAAYQDLRAFLRDLEANGDLLRVVEPLAPEPDVAALADAAFLERGPAVLMEHVTGAAHPLVVGVHATHARIGRALGLPPGQAPSRVAAELDRLWQRYPVPPVQVERTDAPCKAMCRTGDEVSLISFPIVRGNERDGGPYINKGLVITRSPETGTYNVNISRLQVKGPRRLGIWAALHHGPGLHFRMAEARGEDLPIAIAIGCDPLLALAATAPLPESWDEYAFAGALRGAPTQLVPAETVDLLVPAHAEIVLEGWLRTGRNRREVEGPFGEYTGHYSGINRTPVIDLTAITCRRDAIFEQVTIGRPWRETEVMSHLPLSVGILRQVREIVPEVMAFNAASTFSSTCVVSLRQGRGGRAKQVMAAVWALDAGAYVKNLFVVDEEIDVFNWEDVMWAFSTRFRGEPDLMVMPRSYGGMLDPTGEMRGMITRYGFDCTFPVPPDCKLAVHGVVIQRPEVDAWRRWLTGDRSVRPPLAAPAAVVDHCPRCGSASLEQWSASVGAAALIKCQACHFVWRTGETVHLGPEDRLDASALASLPLMPPLL
jgi:UbiD family decarboxylase